MSFNTDLLVAVITGPSSAAIGSFLAYKFAVRQNKKQAYNEYFTEINGMLERILRVGSLKNFKQIYDNTDKATHSIPEQILNLAKKEQVTDMDLMGIYFTAYLDFFSFNGSVNAYLNAIHECGEYERVFNEMDKKGLLATLRKHDPVLTDRLSYFKILAENILAFTRDIQNDIQINSGVTSDFLRQGSVAHDKVLPVLLTAPIDDLINYGKDLKRIIDKRV